MSMIGEYRQISQNLLAKIKQDPTLVEAVIRCHPGFPGAEISEDDPRLAPFSGSLDNIIAQMPLPPAFREAMASMDDQTREQLTKSFEEARSQIAAAMQEGGPLATMLADRQESVVAANAALTQSGITDEDMPQALSIEKAWHGLHFLLCGEIWKGSPPLSNVVMGGAEVGPDVGYGPARYLTPEEVQTVSAALASITDDTLRPRYRPEMMGEVYPTVWKAEGEDALEWLLQAFQDVKAYFASAASKDFAMLLYLT